MMQAPSDEFDPAIWLFLRSAIEAGDHVWIREQSRISQTSLAKIVGCTAQAIGHWEAGLRRPTVRLGMKYGRTLLALEAELQLAAIRRSQADARR